MFLYTSDDFDGEMHECDEGDLKWVEKDQVMNLNLWEGDRIFLKYLVELFSHFFNFCHFCHFDDLTFNYLNKL